MMRSLISLLLIMTLAGCATIISGSSQTIHIRIVNAADQTLVRGATCSVSDGTGTIYSITSNPASIVVSKSSGPIRIDCKRAGFSQKNMGVGNSFNAITIVNVLFWPGFIVDAATGAYKTYPSHYIINMEKVK